MSDQVEEIRCRLCATYFPETDRFCPNCREPRPDVHEDLLMASRLTGVSYEVLLERAWAEDGVIRIRRPAEEIPQAATPAEEAPPSFPVRLLGQRDTATIGCLVLLGVVLVVAIGAAAIIAIRDNFGGGDSNGQRAQTTIAPTRTPTETPTFDAAGNGSAGGTQPAGGSNGIPEEATPAFHRLVLNPAVPAQFSDGAQIRLIGANPSIAVSDATPTPAVGSRYVAIQIEACAGTESLSSGPANWLLEMPDGSQHGSTAPVIDPSLEPADLSNRDCNSGWISFEIPVSVDPSFILMSVPSHEEIRFAWPG